MSGPVFLKLDWETRSEVDLLKFGVYRYVEGEHTDALFCSYKIGDGPLRRWTRGEPCPADIREHIEAGRPIKAHNAAFERLIWWHILAVKHGWPKPKIEQFHCTASTAAAMSLPRSLDRLGQALDLAVKKDKRGKALIKAHSVPQGWTPEGQPIWNDDPAGLTEFHDYCDGDVLTEEAADKRMIPLSDTEQAVYTLNETINDRGIRLDVRSARAAVALAEKAREKLDARMHELTGGAVKACTNVKALAAWVAAQGVEIETIGKEDLEELLEADDVPERVRAVLEVRQEAAKTSVSKISTMLDRVCKDGRIRGVYIHQGAGQTGRFSSRGTQMHNMPKYRKEFEAAKLDMATLFGNIRAADPDRLELMYGPVLGKPLHLLSDATRGFLWAAPGHSFIDVDYTSIEGVLAAWFAKEEWKLQAFRELMAGTGPGMYELLASQIYNVAVKDVTKLQRAGGKVGELSLGYQGGVGALAKMARKNYLKLSTVYGPLWEVTSDERKEDAETRYEERVKKHDATALKLGREGWIAGELIKVGWRAAHPNISQGWKLLEEAARGAVLDRGSVHTALGVKYRVAHGFLWAQLPSGRVLAYGRPRIQEVEAPWADKTVEEKRRETKESVTVLGVDSQTEKWVRFPIYGGSLFNNVVQGSARDILCHGMINAEAAGYPVVLHTHDELAAEMPNGEGSVEELAAIAGRLPAWCAGLPLTASGWRGKRYRKD